MLAGYLREQSVEFLRSLRLHRESGPDATGAGEAVRQLRAASRRISGALHTYRPVVDAAWADHLRSELGWLSGTLAREHACGARLERLLTALRRLTGEGREAGKASEAVMGAESVTASASASVSASAPASASSSVSASSSSPSSSSSSSVSAAEAKEARETDRALAVGAARAGALLERQLTLARTRAHSAALQALGSSRFHAVADAVAVLASEVPLLPDVADRPAAEVLPPLAGHAHRRLAEAVAALPLTRAGYPPRGGALAAANRQDLPWHQVRVLLRLSRFAQEVAEVCDEDPSAGFEGETPRLAEAARALERHRDAAEAAAAAAAAARTPRIAPATAYALGALHADQRHEVEAARFAFGRAWAPARVGAGEPGWSA
ncbi:CHAD domain-containing protein [Streptomyces sp. NPDC003077]|uniref:CHAD domain-containing protein n=1 Tax=Streptomyces sp. NPDC003077 TaxID=3154443 RepID=UPI0033B3B1FA